MGQAARFGGGSTNGHDRLHRSRGPDRSPAGAFSVGRGVDCDHVLADAQARADTR
jgi:hypothetical protein